MSTRPGHWILWLIIIFFLSFIAWAYQAELDEVTRAEGRVIPSQQVQVIQNLEGGILAALYVQEGDIVNIGEPLLSIDDTRFQSESQANRLQVAQLQMQLRRLRAQAANQAPSYQGPLSQRQYHFWQQEYRLYEAEQASLAADISALKAQLAQAKQQIQALKAQKKQYSYSLSLANKELKITRPLVKQGVLSELELLQLQRQLSDIRAKKDKVSLEIPQIEAKLNEIKQRIKTAEANYRAKAQQQHNQTESKLSLLQNQQQTLNDRLERTIVRSPVKGIVKRLKINTIGGVLGPGMDLLEIVPDDDKILIEARVRPADIAFLYMGQTAQIKFSAYDFAIFGGLSAKLSHISADSIQDPQGAAYFLIRLHTQSKTLSKHKQTLVILPGMTVSVELLSGQKTVLNYLLEPIQRIRAKALRES